MSDVVTVFIVDDERAAREELKYLLSGIEGVEVVGEAADGQDALARLAVVQPHVAVLDIRMPTPNGLEVARQLVALSPETRVVFATAHDEHAVEAFDVQAADYVLKPFDPDRVARAIFRAAELPAGPASTTTAEGTPNRLVVERRRQTHLINLSDVLWIGTDSGVVTVATLDDTHYTSGLTLKDVEARLATHGFFRCHREYIVPLDRVRALAPAASGTYRVVLSDIRRTELPVARNRVPGLKRALGLE